MLIKVNGDIVPSSDAWIYKWFGEECTCPTDVRQAIEEAGDDEEIEVVINSGGGDVMAGQEIYTMLSKESNVKIEIQSLAGSAASIIAMAGHCVMSPVAMIMIHNCSCQAAGDYHDMQKAAEVLEQVNNALAVAYVKKTGKTQEEILKMMDEETWLTANQCVKHGFADEIMDGEEPTKFYNGIGEMWLTDERRAQAIREKAEKENEDAKNEILSDLYLFG